MKNRHIIIIVLGFIIIWLTYMSKFGTNIIDAMFWGGFIFIGFILFLVTFVRNIIRFIKERRAQNFFTTYLILAFAIIICGIEYKNQYDFDKPSLLKGSCDGDINRTSIDLKKDGTFIFENSATEIIDYMYGTYTISENKITLDKTFLENVIVTDKLEIRDKEDSENTQTKFLYQIDEKGNILSNEIEFRVIEDNRK